MAKHVSFTDIYRHKIYPYHKVQCFEARYPVGNMEIKIKIRRVDCRKVHKTIEIRGTVNCNTY